MDPTSKDTWYLAKGTCDICGEDDADIAGNKEDAHLFLNHSHGWSKKHCFVGQVTITLCKPPRTPTLKRVA